MNFLKVLNCIIKEKSLNLPKIAINLSYMKMNVRKPTEVEIEETRHWGNWSKEKSVFPWSYDMRETCYILEGEAEVKDVEGNKVHFKKGDLVVFEKGLDCTWEIINPIKKKYKFD